MKASSLIKALAAVIEYAGDVDVYMRESSFDDGRYDGESTVDVGTVRVDVDYNDVTFVLLET